jgi:general secretion pathway protein A
MKTKNPQTQSAMQFYGLRYAPFADTFEIHKPYRSDAEDLIVQRTTALLRQGRSVALYGEAGSGKSMLAKSIVEELDPKAFRIAQIPYGGMKPTAVLRDLCDELDIDTTGRKNLISKLAHDFSRTQEKPFPVIIVDEAHEMARQSYSDLCSLLHDTQKRTAAASLVLVGQPVLKKILELDMPKCTLEDAKAFIAFRLDAAKASTQLFEDDALDALATDAKGNRRMLMNLAALCLEEAARRNDKVVTQEIVNTVTLEFKS